jgi:putative nucleotidyltransferase with HDIG domain
MSSVSSSKSRSARVAAIATPRARLGGEFQRLRQRDVLARLGMCLAAVLVVWAVTRSWEPPFRFRSGYIPPREVVARGTFSVTDERQQVHTYEEGDTLAAAGLPLSYRDIQLLYAEHAAATARLTVSQRLGYSLASLGIYLVLFALCGCYLYFHDRGLLRDWRRLSTVLIAVALTVTASVIAARDAWRAECIPLVVFGATFAVACRRELAFVMSLVVALVLAISLGQGLAEFMILTATVSGPLLLLDRIRSRTKLIYVGLGGAAIAFVTVLGVGILSGQAYGVSHTTHLSPAEGTGLFSQAAFTTRLLSGAAWYGACVVLAGFLMTGLLPFVERWFGVLTDISLLELGDAAHPLLQELARRAPGTYNHSINVASLAEPAADAVDANGLLVRVGAYFHDIGKMLKPNYFIENLGQEVNQHDSLLPAMSTLVIIAHVKDGLDLGRQHRLPQAILDLIEQHHGTTLVEYFYRQAERQRADDPNGGALDESRYRYPGPKPQTREAAVLMLADAAESACRSLVEPTPARIESLVHDISQKRLLDGQFDDCALTLQQLNAIEDSLVKSLTAVYHGRIKYPDQLTA